MKKNLSSVLFLIIFLTHQAAFSQPVGRGRDQPLLEILNALNAPPEDKEVLKSALQKRFRNADLESIYCTHSIADHKAPRPKSSSFRKLVSRHQRSDALYFNFQERDVPNSQIQDQLKSLSDFHPCHTYSVEDFKRRVAGILNMAAELNVKVKAIEMCDGCLHTSANSDWPAFGVQGFDSFVTLFPIVAGAKISHRKTKDSPGFQIDFETPPQEWQQELTFQELILECREADQKKAPEQVERVVRGPAPVVIESSLPIATHLNVAWPESSIRRPSLASQHNLLVWHGMSVGDNHSAHQVFQLSSFSPHQNGIDSRLNGLFEQSFMEASLQGIEVLRLAIQNHPVAEEIRLATGCEIGLVVTIANGEKDLARASHVGYGSDVLVGEVRYSFDTYLLYNQFDGRNLVDSIPRVESRLKQILNAAREIGLRCSSSK